MSEYWKSTPKYWCKHCKVFVRDTKLERQNHDATPRHQGNIKRFLRDLHRGHEKEERDKERAKSEVARLNGLVGGAGHAESLNSSGFGRGPPSFQKKSQATPSQRKQQLAQLAEMGVSIPDEFRGEMAMAGEWQVTSEHVIGITENNEKLPEAIGFGIRKRTAPDDEEEAEAVGPKKKIWGSAYRIHPIDDDADLDALLSRSTAKGKLAPANSDIKNEPLGEAGDEVKPLPKFESEFGNDQKLNVKGEPSDGLPMVPEASPALTGVNIKHEADSAAGNIVFKKRKAKNIRQK